MSGRVAGLTLAAGDALVGVAAAFEDSFGGPLTAAAVAYDQAARLPRSGEGSPRWEQGDAARRLHGAARAVASAGRLASRSDRAAGMELIAALVTLTGSVARLHAAHGRPDQARAADAAQQVRSWQDSRAGLATSSATQGPAAASPAP